MNLFINSCSYLLGVGTANVNHLNVNTSLLTNLSCINSGLNHNLAIIANQWNLSLYTNVFFFNPTHNGDFLIRNNLNDTGFRVRRYYVEHQLLKLLVYKMLIVVHYILHH